MLSSAPALIAKIPLRVGRHYGEALVALVMATILCQLLQPFLSRSAALSIYMMAVAFSARYGSRGPALMALFAGGLLADFLFTEPHGVLHLHDPKTDLAFALHMIVGLLIIHATAQLRISRERALVSEARLRSAAQAGAFGTFDVDFVSGQAFWSDETLAIFGLQPGHQIPLDAKQIPKPVHPDDYDIARRALDAAVDPSGPGVLEADHRILRPDGVQRWIRTRGKALFSGTGSARKVVRVIGAVHDVTERKLAESQLERHAHALQERMKELDCIYTFARITGQAGLSTAALENVLKSLATAYQYPEVICARIDVQGRVCQTDNFRHSQWRQRSPILVGGREIGHIEVGYHEARPAADEGPFLKEERDLIDAVAVLVAGKFHHWQDRNALIESETRFQHLVEAIPEILFRGVCRPFKLTFVSPPVQRLLGFSPADCLQARDIWIGQLHDEDRERVLQEAEAIRARPDLEFMTLEYRLWHKDRKTFRWFRDRSRMERDDKGKVISFVGVLSDITERKRLEQALQEADQRKDTFLATLAHELRNPLAPISNAFALIRRGGDRPDLVKKALETGERQMAHMLRIVDELLDIARISSGKVTLNLEQVSLRALVEQAVELSRPQIESGGHQLVIELPESEVMLQVDPLRLTQVLSNLLNNAAKYTDAGGRIRLIARSDFPGRELLIDIEDNGIGIPSDLLPHVFDLFRQGAQSRHRIWQGLGLGLPLAKYLAELHGGQLAAASAGQDKGSTFRVRLPLAPSTTFAQASEKSSDCRMVASALRILLVDDDKDVADTTAMLLREEGHEVLVAYDGAAAVELALNCLPAIVILDIGLPGMNGYEVARRLRALHELDATWVIALTGWGTHQDRRSSEQAGMDHHIVKPVNAETLLTLMRYCATFPRSPGGSRSCSELT